MTPIKMNEMINVNDLQLQINLIRLLHSLMVDYEKFTENHLKALAVKGDIKHPQHRDRPVHGQNVSCLFIFFSLKTAKVLNGRWEK